MRCVEADVFVPAGEMAEVKIAFPPEDLGSMLWVRPLSGDKALRDELAGRELQSEPPDGLTVVEGPLEMQGGADGTLSVLVRAPEGADVLIEPGEAVCVLSQATEEEVEISNELATEEVDEVKFEGEPPSVRPLEQLWAFSSGVDGPRADRRPRGGLAFGKFGWRV